MLRFPFSHRRNTTTTTLESSVRELCSRVSDGIHVLLLWHPVDDSVSISIDDKNTGERFEFPVDRHRALFAFNHPFAYAR